MFDKKTYQILYELSNNSRIPLKQLAKKVKLSESATSYRLKQLYDQNIILGTTPIFDHSKLGHLIYRIYSNFFGTTSEKEKEILNWLKEQKEVSVLARSSGDYDFLIMSSLSSPLKFHNFIKKLKEKYRKYLGIIDTFIYLKTYHFSRDYFNQKKKNPVMVVIGESKSEKIDDIDKKIIRCIAPDARKSVLKIAEEIKVPVRTVANRLKNLEKKKIIAGYTINLNLQKIGREYFKLNIISNENVDYNTLINFALNLDESIYIDETIGKYDFELNIEVKDRNELNKIINLLKNKMGGFKDLGIFQVEKYIKLTYLGI